MKNEPTTNALPIFVFDFDGVVCDSTNECMVTSWNAWECWQERDEFRRAVSEFSKLEQISFRALRPRVRGAGEYYILRRALAEGISINDQVSYDQLVLAWQEHLEPFGKTFFEMRNRLRCHDIGLWIDLHPVYQEVIDVMTCLHLQGRLYIATLKDGESVRLILAKHGLVLPEDHLLDQSQIISKVQALNKIRDQLGCDKTDLVFIDDNVTHLLEPHMSGYPVLMATWGPVFSEYLALAQQEQIPILDSQTALKQIVLENPNYLVMPSH